jgi:hypothetical protein
MQICLPSSNLQLRVRSGSEISCPVIILIISIREHVSSLNGVAQILLLDCIQILAWSGIEDCNVGGMIIEVLNKSIDRLKVVMSISIGKVATHHYKKLVSLIDVKLLVNPCSKKIGFLISIELFTCRISNHWIVTAETIIKPKNERDIAVATS